MINLENILAIIELIKKCNECAVFHFNNMSKISYKNDFSPVTNGDIEVSKIAVAGLNNIFPNTTIISEETFKSQHNFDLNNDFWLIDPIDGTKEYINGSPNFTVNFALIKNYSSVFGIISQPLTGKIWFNYNNKAFRLDKNKNFKQAKQINCNNFNYKHIKTLSSHSHRTKDLENWINLVNPKLQKNIGSSIKFCLLAEGVADLYPRNSPTMEWDIAAGHSILRAAGGNILTESGMEVKYGKANFKNKNFLAHGKLSKRLPSYFLIGLQDFNQIKYFDDMFAAVKAIEDNKLVAFPTETVYGIGAIGNNINAIKSIYSAKNRPSNNPLIAHTFKKSIAEKLVRFTKLAHLLTDKFWPGPLTIILQTKNTKLSNSLSQGKSTLAFRVPSHPVALDLLEKVKVPILAPSANKSGGVSPTSAVHVKEDFGPNFKGKNWELVSILDYGTSEVGIESTVIDCRGDNPIILRHGSVTSKMIYDVTKKEVLTLGKVTKLISPGLLTSHYSPKAKVLLNQNKKIKDSGWLNFGKISKSLQNQENVFNLSNERNLIQAAELLYSGLRFLDSKGVNVIQVMPIPKIGLGIAINDRLSRASSKD